MELYVSLGQWQAFPPVGALEVGGVEVEYSDWWLSAAGIEFFAAMTTIGLEAPCLLYKVIHAQQAISLYLLVV